MDSHRGPDSIAPIRAANDSPSLWPAPLRLRSSNPSTPSRSPVINLRPSTVRLRRVSSSNNLASPNVNTPRTAAARARNVPSVVEEGEQSARRRSSSEPQRPLWVASPAAINSARGSMPPLTEEARPEGLASPQHLSPPGVSPGRIRRASIATLNALGLNRLSSANEGTPVFRSPIASEQEYGSDVVDLLDVIDPEVSTLSTLTNVQNSLFIPDLGPIINRRPTYNLTRPPESPESTENSDSEVSSVAGKDNQQPPIGEHLQTISTIDSTLSDSRFAVLPHGVSLDGWTWAEKQELNDHVRHMLHSRRSKFKRGLKGFGQYIRKPLGFLVTLYATLITLFGLAWVLFLIGWINVEGRQLYMINVIDSVLVALFNVVGIGFAPFRAIDTYHMIYIAYYHRLTWRLRKERALPDLQNKNDLPSVRESQYMKDLEAGAPPQETEGELDDHPHEFSVLTPKQQATLQHHQDKFSKSHTFYKPHETVTHSAFSLRLLMTIVILLDFHSIFQMVLAGCTWGIYYKVRPFALTTVILCCSLTCNITAGILISVGDKRSRKKEVIEKMSRQQLTEEAIRKVERRRKREEERNARLEEEAQTGRKSGDWKRSFDLRRSLDWKRSPDPSGRANDSRRSLDVRRAGRSLDLRRTSDWRDATPEQGRKSEEWMRSEPQRGGARGPERKRHERMSSDQGPTTNSGSLSAFPSI